MWIDTWTDRHTLYRYRFIDTDRYIDIDRYVHTDDIDIDIDINSFKYA